MTDPELIRGSQYRTSSNLDARIQLHLRFSTNPYGWYRWVFDSAGLSQEQVVLEAGCGPGNLWAANLERLPSGGRYILADFSPGMAAAARGKLGSDPRFSFLAADLQHLPFDRPFCDLALANHMLYHLPDIRLGLLNLARALKPGGRLVAATNGDSHLRELHRLIGDFEPAYQAGIDPSSDRFGLQTGAALLEEVFGRVDCYTYPDSFWVTEPEPLVDYIYSTWSTGPALQGHSRAELAGFIARRIAAQGGIFIQKESGVFVAKNPPP